jgi:hypothetical protein
MIDYDELDTLEEVDKLLVHMLRELRQILEDETGL